jgi:predicted RNase H-like HicB family nuclease
MLDITRVLSVNPERGAHSTKLINMELIFDVHEEDGILVAVCKNPDLATHGRNLEELIQMVKEVIACHFDEGDERRKAKARLNFHEESALAYE